MVAGQFEEINDRAKNHVKTYTEEKKKEKKNSTSRIEYVKKRAESFKAINTELKGDASKLKAKAEANKRELGKV